ncbi:hypothetical protein BRC81_15080 [Halobacteriales archaeon QS_1_68_20]|nr:MAG: hypothetical protein BRC81_15080 [Halobacteriales archaeon QS_1_68_20]
MTTLRDRVPKPLRTPVGILSYLIALVGIAVGYVLVMLGLVLYYDLALDEHINSTEALTVLAVGIVVSIIGYLGIKGFMYFSY